jgi:hypothetical protein
LKGVKIRETQVTKKLIFERKKPDFIEQRQQKNETVYRRHLDWYSQKLLTNFSKSLFEFGAHYRESNQVIC